MDYTDDLDEFARNLVDYSIFSVHEFPQVRVLRFKHPVTDHRRASQVLGHLDDAIHERFCILRRITADISRDVLEII